MKSFFLILIFFPLISNAQQLRHSVFIAAPSFSLFNSSSPAILSATLKGSFGAGAGYSTEYYLNKTLSMGGSIEYSLLRGKLYTNCFCGHPLDRIVSIRNNLSTHSIDIPFYINFRMNKNENKYLYFKSGFGSSILAGAYRVVEREVHFLGRAPVERVELSSENFQLRNESKNIFGSFFLITVGQALNINNINLFSEIAFRQDINFWYYHTLETPAGISQVSFKRQSFILKTGILF
jgi:hypothetical protein